MAMGAGSADLGILVPPKPLEGFWGACEGATVIGSALLPGSPPMIPIRLLLLDAVVSAKRTLRSLGRICLLVPLRVRKSTVAAGAPVPWVESLLPVDSLLCDPSPASHQAHMSSEGLQAACCCRRQAQNHGILRQIPRCQ